MAPGRVKTVVVEKRGEPICMYLVKWEDKGYKKVLKRTTKQRSKGNRKTTRERIVLEWDKLLERVQSGQTET